MLANKTNYLLELLMWQKTKDGQSKHPRKMPKIFVPDFMKNAEETAAINRDSEAHTVEDIKAILARSRK